MSIFSFSTMKPTNIGILSILSIYLFQRITRRFVTASWNLIVYSFYGTVLKFGMEIKETSKKKSYVSLGHYKLGIHAALICFPFPIISRRIFKFQYMPQLFTPVLIGSSRFSAALVSWTGGAPRSRLGSWCTGASTGCRRSSRTCSGTRSRRASQAATCSGASSSQIKPVIPIFCQGRLARNIIPVT